MVEIAGDVPVETKGVGIRARVRQPSSTFARTCAPAGSECSKYGADALTASASFQIWTRPQQVTPISPR